jgi:hypothetical protein
MPRKKTITSAVSAVKDLEAIRTWYADQQVPAVGERLPIHPFVSFITLIKAG